MESWILWVSCKVKVHLLCKRPKVFIISWTFQKSNWFLKSLWSVGLYRSPPQYTHTHTHTHTHIIPVHFYIGGHNPLSFFTTRTKSLYWFHNVDINPPGKIPHIDPILLKSISNFVQSTCRWGALNCWHQYICCTPEIIAIKYIADRQPGIVQKQPPFFKAWL